MIFVVAETYWNISGYVIFWVLSITAFSLFIQRAYLLFRLVRLGRQDKRSESICRRIRAVLIEVILQWGSLRSVNRKDLAGIGHAFMVWGFGLFIIGYIIFIGFGGGLGLSTVLAGSEFETVYLSILDIAGLFVIAAIVWAAVKRYIVRPARLEASTRASGALLIFILTLMFTLIMLHYCVEGFGYAASNIPASWPPIGATLASFLTNTGISETTLVAVYKGVWWLQYVIVLGFVVYAAHSKHLHPLAAPMNLLSQSSGTRWTLKPIYLEEQAESFGVSKIQDFTWKQLLDLYACTECGRCYESCPAVACGKSLSPREVILKLQKHLLKAGPRLLEARGNGKTSSDGSIRAMIGEVVTPQEIWECTTCGACQQVCPAHIQPIDKIIDMRRNLVLELASIPEIAERALQSIEDIGHPWRGTTLSREDWAEGLDIRVLADDGDVDILFWVGCTEALGDRSVRIAQAAAKLFKLAGIEFGILGFEESCCGEPARRLGNEYLFQILAKRNIELMKSHNVKKIVTACPHCYNTIRNEYPQFGGDFEVVHHTEFIARLLEEGRLKTTKSLEGIVTYHDPCYLGRYNNIYGPPRRILSSIHGLTIVEMLNNRRDSLCCGGGGGHMWLERGVGQAIGEMRLGQAIDSKAKIVATACPWCIDMLEDGMKTIEEPLRVMDIAELVERQL